MRNAVAIKPRASLDGKAMTSHGASAGGNGGGRESFRSFFAALDIDAAPEAESNGNSRHVAAAE